MKNLLYWLYISLAMLVIVGSMLYFKQQLTTEIKENQEVKTSEIKSSKKENEKNDKSTEEHKKSSQKKLKVTFRDKDLQDVYKEKVKNDEVLKVVVVTTPYQVAENDDSVFLQLQNKLKDHIELIPVEVDSNSSTLNAAAINNIQADAILLDALTIGDFYEGMTPEDHIAQLQTITDGIESKNLIVIGNRNDSNDGIQAFIDLELKAFKDKNIKYINQSDAWPLDGTDYNSTSGLLTQQGLTIWVKAIESYLID